MLKISSQSHDKKRYFHRLPTKDPYIPRRMGADNVELFHLPRCLTPTIFDDIGLTSLSFTQNDGSATGFGTDMLPGARYALARRVAGVDLALVHEPIAPCDPLRILAHAALTSVVRNITSHITSHPLDSKPYHPR